MKHKVKLNSRRRGIFASFRPPAVCGDGATISSTHNFFRCHSGCSQLGGDLFGRTFVNLGIAQHSTLHWQNQFYTDSRVQSVPSSFNCLQSSSKSLNGFQLHDALVVSCSPNLKSSLRPRNQHRQGTDRCTAVFRTESGLERMLKAQCVFFDVRKRNISSGSWVVLELTQGK